MFFDSTVQPFFFLFVVFLLFPHEYQPVSFVTLTAVLLDATKYIYMIFLINFAQS